MAKRKGRKRGKHRARSSGGKFVARHNPHRRHRHRSNPPRLMSLVKSVPAFAGRALIGGVGVTGGIVIARTARGLAKQEPGSVLGSVIEMVTGIVAGFGVSMIPKCGALGEAIAAGGVAAPVMTFLQNRKLKFLSALGDDGFLIGEDTGLTLVSAHPDDYGRVVGDIPKSMYAAGGDVSVQGYTGGAAKAARMAAAQTLVA